MRRGGGANSKVKEGDVQKKEGEGKGREEGGKEGKGKGKEGEEGEDAGGERMRRGRWEVVKGKRKTELKGG